jgi:hypothetical protein
VVFYARNENSDVGEKVRSFRAGERSCHKKTPAELTQKRRSKMEPNEIAIRRVYTRETGEWDPDATISAAVPVGNQIVVEWEAGGAANAQGPFNIEILTHNVTTGAFENNLTWSNAVTVPPPVGPAFVVPTDGLNHHATYELVIPFGWIPPVDMTYEITASLYRPSPAPPPPVLMVSFAKWLFRTT